MPRSRLPAIVIALAMVVPATAGEEMHEFYRAKQLATSPEAFYRAEERLARVRPGMTEVQLFETLGMQTVERRRGGGGPVDALLDGYLSRASDKVNDGERDPSLHHLWFGYVEGDVEIARYEVLLKDRQVQKVVPLAGRDLPPPDVDVGRSKRKYTEAKRQSTSPEAFSRAERRLRSVRVDMAELEFLDVMQMVVLSSGERPIDAFVEGYLPDASHAANKLSRGAGARHLVFGWVDKRQEHPRHVVTVRDHRVASVERLEPIAVAPAEVTTR